MKVKLLGGTFDAYYCTTPHPIDNMRLIVVDYKDSIDRLKGTPWESEGIGKDVFFENQVTIIDDLYSRKPLSECCIAS